MTTDTHPPAPTDSEIIAVMRDGYNCRYNDEQDHVDFARAVLAKWGPQPLRYDQSPTLFTVFAKCDEYEGEVPLAQYSATSEYGVLDRVMGDARNAGYTGHAKDRMTELGWRIVPVYAKPQPTQAQAGAVPLTDEQIDAVAESMPGGLAGFLKGWGWRQFAREILTLRRMPDWEPQFDCMTPKQEELAIQFCQEIAGPRGERGSPPDPVRLLEMAEALYKAEREHHHGTKGGQHGADT